VKPAPPFRSENVSFRVIKVGGSLFTLPDLRQRLLDWSNGVADESCVNVWVAGGGAFVDQVRHWQALHGLDEKAAHRISIGLMSQTAGLLQSLFSDWPLLENVSQFEAAPKKGTRNVVFDCRQWSLENESLEKSWETTSDTISLHLAVAIRASHLFLLKSKLPKSNQVSRVIQEDLIDRSFAAGFCGGNNLIASVVDLRDSNETIELVW
jgi:aspartokinase-like uncharacterized kinase